MTERDEAIQRVLDGTPNYAGPDGEFTLCWGETGVGFGEAVFYWSNHEEGGPMKLYCENECMGKEFIKRMLCRMVDDATFKDD